MYKILKNNKQAHILPNEKGMACIQISPIHIKLNVAIPSKISNEVLKWPFNLSAKCPEIKAATHEAILDQNPSQPTVFYKSLGL